MAVAFAARKDRYMQMCLMHGIHLPGEVEKKPKGECQPSGVMMGYSFAPSLQI